MVRFKSCVGGADEDGMGRQSAAIFDERAPRNVRIARKRIFPGGRLVAVVIECVDETCTVVGNGIALSCPSIQQAMRVVEAIAPRIAWREKTPGFWVARSAAPALEAPVAAIATMPVRVVPSWRARPR